MVLCIAFLEEREREEKLGTMKNDIVSTSFLINQLNSGQHPCGPLPADEGPAPGAEGPLLLLDHPAAADDEGPQPGAEGPPPVTAGTTKSWRPDIVAHTGCQVRMEGNTKQVGQNRSFTKDKSYVSLCGSLPAEKPGHVRLTFLHCFSS